MGFLYIFVNLSLMKEAKNSHKNKYDLMESINDSQINWISACTYKNNNENL